MDIKEIKLQELSVANVKELKEISIKTFVDTYSAFNTKENISGYVEKSFNLEQLINELNEKHTTFYFAKHKEKILGYLKIRSSVVNENIKEKNTLEINRIYILKEFQGKGIGSKLLIKAIEIAKFKKREYIWLGVWQKNESAINFYKKHHFEISGTYPFQLGNEKQSDYIMKLNTQVPV